MGSGGGEDCVGERERKSARACVVFFFLQICSDRAFNTPNARVFCANMKRFLRYPLKLGLRVNFM